MSVEVAEILVLVLAIYLTLGLIVGLAYFFGGAGRIDPAARGKGMPIRVRFMIMPGIIGLWPLMLVKLFTQKAPPIQ